jgi:hypothetical protein
MTAFRRPLGPKCAQARRTSSGGAPRARRTVLLLVMLSGALGCSFLIDNGLPNLEATVTVRDDANNEAPAGFLNAAPGFTVFSARIGQAGPRLGEFNANVRASAVTYLDIYP